VLAVDPRILVIEAFQVGVKDELHLLYTPAALPDMTSFPFGFFGVHHGIIELTDTGSHIIYHRGPMTNWQKYIDPETAVRADDGTLLHFGTAPAAEEQPVAAICDDLTVVHARGEDTPDFLQGQITADVKDVDAGANRPAMHLNLKGRGVVGMRVVPADEGYWLILDRHLVESARKALGKFILRSKVTLEPDPERVVLRLSGTDADQALARADLPCPEDGATMAAAPGVRVARPGQTDQYLVMADADTVSAVLEQLPASFTRGAALHGRLQAIRGGDGQVRAGAEERFMPQELNYDLLGGISFKKGCYVGQEVVARMHFRGHLKQRMRRLSWPADEAPEPGTSLRDDRGRGRGEIVDAVLAGERCEALAVLRHTHQGPLFTDAGELDWRVESLPYELPDE
jgi:folate-binding protein YgfZ